jgi:hypothetical protein
MLLGIYVSRGEEREIEDPKKLATRDHLGYSLELCFECYFGFRGMGGYVLRCDLQFKMVDLLGVFNMPFCLF